MMKVKDLIDAIRVNPEAEVKISTHSFVREPLESISVDLHEITLCSFDLIGLIAQTAEARINDDDSDDDDDNDNK